MKMGKERIEPLPVCGSQIEILLLQKHLLLLLLLSGYWALKWPVGLFSVAKILQHIAKRRYALQDSEARILTFQQKQIP